MPSPANILFLMFDQCRASTAYGNPLVRFPFLERVAASGISFANAYAASAICTPSRTTIHTGVHPHVHQVTCYQNWAPYNLPQLAELLLASGYETMSVGHYDGGQNLARGWRQQSRSNDTGSLSRAYNLWATCGRKDVVWAAGTRPCTAEQGHASLVTNRILAMLEGVRDAGAPFFAQVCYEDPHNPYFAPPPYDTLVDPELVRLPDQGRTVRKPSWQYKVWEQSGTERATATDVRKLIAIYNGMVAYVDAQMNRIFDHLGRAGILENTWIIVTSDHGDYLGEKGMFAKTESLYECLLHVPLIIRPPDNIRAPRGVTVDGLVDLADLFPTMLGMAGATVPAHAQGRDLMKWIQDGGKPFRDGVYSQVGDYHGSLKTTWPGGMPEAGRHPGLLEAVRTADYSYIHDPDYGAEAYDLRSDPRELDNLLGGGGIAPPELDGLRRRLDSWRESCHRLREKIGVKPGPRGFEYE